MKYSDKYKLYLPEGSDYVTPEQFNENFLALERLIAALEAHKHAAGDVTSGTLAAARLPTVPINKGGTGATTAAAALTALGAAAKNHDHTYTISGSYSGTGTGQRLALAGAPRWLLVQDMSGGELAGVSIVSALRSPLAGVGRESVYISITTANAGTVTKVSGAYVINSTLYCTTHSGGAGLDQSGHTYYYWGALK